MPELIGLVGESNALSLKDAYMKDGGDNPSLVADEIYRLTGEKADPKLVYKLEKQWYDELEELMGPPRSTMATTPDGRVISGLYTDTGSDELARLDHLYDRLERAEMNGNEAKIAKLQKEIDALEKIVECSAKPVTSGMTYDPVDAWVSALMDEFDEGDIANPIEYIETADGLDVVHSLGLEVGDEEAEEFNSLWPEIRQGLLKELNTVSLSSSLIQSGVEVDTSNYVNEYGKRPSGKGYWAFHIGSKNAEPVFFQGDYATAKQQAIQKAKEQGVFRIFVASSLIQSDFKGLVQMVKGWLQRVHEGLMESNVFYQNLMRLLKGNGYPGPKANDIYKELMAGKPPETVMASYKPIRSSGERELAVKWAAQSQAEQFFRTPSGFLSKAGILFNGSEEDKDLFCKSLGGHYATWGNDRQVSDKWYDMVIKIAEESVSIGASFKRSGFGSSFKRPVKSSWQGGNPMSELLELIGEFNAWKLHDAYMKDGGDNPTLVADEIYRLTGEPATDPFVEALEEQWYAELEESMGPPRRVGEGGERTPLRSALSDTPWETRVTDKPFGYGGGNEIGNDSDLHRALQLVEGSNVTDHQSIYSLLWESGEFGEDDDQVMDLSLMVCDQLGVPVASSVKPGGRLGFKLPAIGSGFDESWQVPFYKYVDMVREKYFNGEFDETSAMNSILARYPDTSHPGIYKMIDRWNNELDETAIDVKDHIISILGVLPSDLLSEMGDIIMKYRKGGFDGKEIAMLKLQEKMDLTEEEIKRLLNLDVRIIGS